jgi:hypothetical protein
MNNFWPLLWFLLVFCYYNTAGSLEVTPEIAQSLGEKIWKNECQGTVEGLTHWNRGENFGSFGIGHFIWYPYGHQEPFKETFPDLLKYLQVHRVVLPEWLRQAQGCPWQSRDEFLQNLQSTKMVSLRQTLLETKNLQASFMVERFEKAVLEITNRLTPQDKSKVLSIIATLSKDFRGLYAMIDYLNFKGMGALPLETYQGQGWGLLQVLLRISPESKNVLSDFAAEAKAVLRQRVQNAPPERHEERWLKGWLNRMDTYLQ